MGWFICSAWSVSTLDFKWWKLLLLAFGALFLSTRFIFEDQTKSPFWKRAGPEPMSASLCPMVSYLGPHCHRFPKERHYSEAEVVSGSLHSSMQHCVMLMASSPPFYRALCWDTEYVKQLLPLVTEFSARRGIGIQELCSDPATLFLCTEVPRLYLQITHLHCKVRSCVRKRLYVQVYCIFGRQIFGKFSTYCSVCKSKAISNC